tara:strand:- start:2074 stop:2529 length:456 start_codon:yes stop_codon:yes gene_type:complete
MEVILLENISNLGKIGEVVKVKNGYARNFLLTQGKALRSNKENIDFVNKKKDELNKKNNEIKKEFKKIADKINNKSLVFFKETKENGDLYASIKQKEISSSFLEKMDSKIEPSSIDLKKEINKIGKYIVDINLHADVKVKVKLEVKKAQNK